MNIRVTAWAAILAAGIAAVAPSQAEQNFLLNGSMEAGAGPGGIDPHVPLNWIRQGAVVERSEEANFTPVDGVAALKAFSSEPQELAYQEVAVTPGQSVTIACSMFTKSTDRLSGDAMAGIVLEFYNAGGQLTGGPYVNFALTAASAPDVWHPVSLGPRTAPANSVKARMSLVWIWSGAASGACFWDGCSLRINGGANLLLNPDFELAGQGENSPIGIDHWTGFEDQGKSSDITAWHGEHTLRVGMSEPFSGLVQNMGVLADGDRILLKARVRNDSSDAFSGTSRAGIKLEFYDPAGTTLPLPTENLAINASSTPDTWIQVPVSMDPLEVPEGATLARITLIFFGDTTPAGSVYFDSAHAEVSSSPGSNLLLNASFENGVGGLNGIDNWTEFGGSGATAQQAFAQFESIPAHDGSFVVKATGGVTGLFQGVTVTAGDLLSAHAYMRIKASDLPSAGDFAGIKVEWFGGTIPGNVDITSSPSNNTITASSPQDQWIDLFIDYTMPPGSFAGVRFVALTAQGGSAVGAAHFDGCEAVVYYTIDGSDYDKDSDVDLADAAAFQRCFAPGSPPAWNCTVFDLDEDDEVDLQDWALLSPHVAGPQ